MGIRVLAISTDLAGRLLSLGRRGTASRVLQGLATGLIVAVLVYALYRNRDQLQEASFSLDYTLLALSFLLWLGSYLLFALGWKLVLQALGTRVDWWRASRAWFVSQGLKYIPGSVVYVAGRVYMAHGEGVGGMGAAVGFALECLLALATALLVFVAVLPFGLGSNLPLPLILAPLPVLAGVVVSVPLALRWAAARSAGKGIMPIGYGPLVLLTAFYVMTWFPAGLAAYLAFRSLGQPFPLGFGQVLGIYTLSWAAGFVAFFAPGGLGVRDGMLIVLMSGLIPLPLATLGVVVIRIETLAVEGLLAFLAIKSWPNSAP